MTAPPRWLRVSNFTQASSVLARRSAANGRDTTCPDVPFKTNPSAVVTAPPSSDPPSPPLVAAAPCVKSHPAAATGADGGCQTASSASHAACERAADAATSPAARGSLYSPSARFTIPPISRSTSAKSPVTSPNSSFIGRVIARITGGTGFP